MRYSAASSAPAAVGSEVSLTKCGYEVIEGKLEGVEGSRKISRGYTMIKEKNLLKKNIKFSKY